MSTSRSRTPVLASLAAILVLAAFSLALAQDAPKPEPTPEQKPAKPIAMQILGPWSIDIPKTLAAMIRQEEKKNEGKEIEEDTKVLMATMVNKMAEGLQLDFIGEGKIKAHQPEKTENATYKITGSKEASGEFTMSVTPDGEDDADVAQCKVSGDHLVMGVEDGKFEIHLKRLSRDEAKAQLDKMQEQKEKEDDFDKDLGEGADDSGTEENTEKKD